MQGLLNFADCIAHVMEKVKYHILWSLTILALVFVISCKRTPAALPDEIVINGTVSNGAGRIVWLKVFNGSTATVIDSAKIEKDGTFSFRLKPKSAGFYLVSIRSNDYALLIGQKGETITLVGDADHLQSSWTTKGSKETNLYWTYFDAARRQLKRADSLTFIFRTSQVTPEYIAIRIRLDSIFNSIIEQQRNVSTQFVTQHPGSLASLLVLDANFSKIPLFNEVRDINYFHRVDSCLAKSYPGNPLVERFHKRILDTENRIREHQINQGVVTPGERSPSLMPRR